MQRVNFVDKWSLPHVVPIPFTAYGNQKGNPRHFFSKGLGALVTRILTRRPPFCVCPEFRFKLSRRRQRYLCSVAFQCVAALRNIFKVRHIFASSSPAHTSSHNQQLFLHICLIEMSPHVLFLTARRQECSCQHVTHGVLHHETHDAHKHGAVWPTHFELIKSLFLPRCNSVAGHSRGASLLLRQSRMLRVDLIRRLPSSFVVTRMY